MQSSTDPRIRLGSGRAAVLEGVDIRVSLGSIEESDRAARRDWRRFAVNVDRLDRVLVSQRTAPGGFHMGDTATATSWFG